MAFQGDSIFWVDTEKVVPNPFQPRREFDQNKLQELSESIRMYGVLQPLTVTRSEVQRGDGTFYTEYELIAGERRLRASRLAGVAQVPVIIREGEQNEQEKLELAIIENLQREDLNAIDRALAFEQLAEQFKLSHTQVAQKVGRSREYVSNSIRLLALPDHIKLSLQRGDLGEGHARTLLMLNDKTQEQENIFREILLKKMSVREVERIVRKIATDKVRKKNHEDIGDHLIEIEKEFTETLGTRVQIQKTDFGGKLTIDYFSEEDLSAILKRMQSETGRDKAAQTAASVVAMSAATPLVTVPTNVPVAPEQLEGHQSSEQPSQSFAAAPMQPETAVADRVHQSEPPAPLVAPPVTRIQSQPETPVEPSVEPDLPQNLSSHTSFGYSRPAPVPETVPIARSTTEKSDTIKPPALPQVESPVQNPSESNLSAPQPLPPTDQDTKKDSLEDMYSIRNFSI